MIYTALDGERGCPVWRLVGAPPRSMPGKIRRRIQRGEAADAQSADRASWLSGGYGHAIQLPA